MKRMAQVKYYCLNVILYFFLSSSLANADSTSIYWANDTMMVDLGHCPGEGCIYGTWIAHENIPVFKAPFDTSKVGIIHPSDTFTAITGNVYFIPEIIILDEDITDYCAYNEKGEIPFQKGDSLYILTNIGEGHYKVRIRNQYGITSCWENDKFNLWWVKVSTKNGIGWILNFPGLRVSGSDAFE